MRWTTFSELAWRKSRNSMIPSAKAAEYPLAQHIGIADHEANYIV